MPRTDAEAAAATSTATPSTIAVSSPSPPSIASNENENGGNESVAAPDAAATSEIDAGVQAASGGAAASTTNSSPDTDSPEATRSSQAQAQDGEAAAEQTPVQALDIASPTEPPSSTTTSIQISAQEQQESPPSIQPSAQEQLEPAPSIKSPPIPIQEQENEQPPLSSSAAPLQTSSSQSQPTTTENSQTDDSAAPTTPPVNVNNAGDRPEEPVLTPVPPDTSTPGADGAAAEDTQPGVTDGSGGSSMPSTAVLAGSIAGGVALVSIIAFLLWFWRKKAINKRRSSLLTPLTIPPGAGKSGGRGSEKTAYVIDRESLGPTPRGQQFRAVIGAKFRRLRGNSQASVDLNRGASSRDVVTGKDRFKDWWERLTADVNFNWKLRNDGAGDVDPAAAARDVRERSGGGASSQPDFLTLLGMDDKEVQREAARRQAGHTKGASSGSDHFLGGLGLNFDSSTGGGTKENPFSDMNALSHDSAKPAPLTVSPSGAGNPFSDDNALRGPATYVADVRRSRGHPGDAGVYRESVLSDAEPRRTKFRSDPFDLERPELLGSRQDLSLAEEVGRPRRAHTREGSFSSKYSSGFSLGDWSDPGPDVGPGGSKKGGEGPVGKAL